MIKRTSINLDLDLVAAAKRVLGTTETTETIHRALGDLVRREKLDRLVRRRFDLGPEERDWLRRPRAALRTPARQSSVGAR